MAKICVITGGTSGIGKCTAEAMAQKGYMKRCCSYY